MDKETSPQAIEHGPVRVTINDGSAYDIKGLRDVAIDETVCYLMRRDNATRRHKAVVCRWYA